MIYVFADGFRVADVVESEVNWHKFSNWLKINLKKCSENNGILVKHRNAEFITATVYFGGGASPGLVRGSFSADLAAKLLSGSSANVSVTADSSSSSETNKK